MADFELTLYDFKDEMKWVGMLGWTDDQLRSVPVHEDATAGVDYLNLANFGGTALGVSARSGGGTSANVSSIRNMYVYKPEVDPDLYSQLEALLDRGGPSGYNEDGIFGERGEATDFPPA